MARMDRPTMTGGKANVYSIRELGREDGEGREAHQQISTLLRDCDQAILLPGAHYSTSDSDLGLQNVVYELNGETKKFSHGLLNENWGHGVAVVRLNASAVALLPPFDQISESLCELRDSLPNVVRDSELSVGPGLYADGAHDVGETDWEPGFDSSNCLVGLYSALEYRPSYANGEAPLIGTTRAHLAYYLVVRAGAGTAADEFHRYLMQALQQGLTLHTALENIATQGGFQNVDGLLTRLANAGRRNRAHLMLLLARAIGLESEITCALDHSTRRGRAARQMATLDLDTVTNVFERGESPGFFNYFANAVAPKTSQGVVICSNLASGLFLYRPYSSAHNEAAWARGATSIAISNDVLGAIPFGPQRACSDQDLLGEIEHRCKNAIARFNSPTKTAFLDTLDTPTVESMTIEQLLKEAHPDYDWCRAHFSWYTPTKKRTLALSARGEQQRHGTRSTDDPRSKEIYEQLPPLTLWNTHAPMEPTSW